MTKTYRTIEGEVLDAIAYRLYGDCDAVHEIIELNPHLANMPAKLPFGVLLKMPKQKPRTQTPQTIRLWG